MSPVSPLSPVFLSYISSNKSLEDVCADIGEPVESVREIAKSEGWEKARKAVSAKLRQIVASDVTRDKFAQIRRLQDRERRQIERRLKTLESVLDGLDPTAEKEIDRLTVSKLKAYAETAAIFQRMLYKSYGIDDTRQAADSDGIFSSYPAGTVIKRYTVEQIETGGNNPPPGGNSTTPPHPHLTPTDPSHIKKPEPYFAGEESVAEVVEDKPTRRKRGKLSGYELTDVFDNISMKEARDEGRKESEEVAGGEGGRGGEGSEDRGEGSGSRGERDMGEDQGMVLSGGEGPDGGSGEDAAVSQAGVVDEGGDLVSGEEDRLSSEVGEGEIVADDTGVGSGDFGGPQGDQEGAAEGESDSGVSGSGDCGAREEPVEEGPRTAGHRAGDAFEDIS